MSSWIPLSGREGGTVPTVILSPSFTADRTAFAATNTGLFISRDGGKSWEIRSKGFGSFAVQAVAFSSSFAADRTVWAGAADGGVYCSVDSGESWALLAQLGGGSAVVGLSAEVASDGKTTVMAGTIAEGVFVSVDGGKRWKQRNSGLSDLSILALAMSPAYGVDRSAFAATAAGLHRTSDGGGSWNQLLATASDDAVQGVAVSPGYSTDRTIFIGTEKRGVLRSRDGGVTWHTVNAGMPALCVNTVALSPGFDQDRVAAAATAQGVALSTDGGESWHPAPAGSEVVLAVGISRLGPTGSVILAGMFDAGILRSEDGGANWSTANRGLMAHYLVGLAVSPDLETDSTLFLWGPSEGLLRSEDRGETHAPASPEVEGSNIFSVVVSPSFAADGTLFAGTPIGVLRSQDRGRSWHSVGQQDQEVGYVAISPAFQSDATVVAATSCALHWSSDRGESWQEMGLPAEREIVAALSIGVDARGKPVVFLASWREPSFDRSRLRVWSKAGPDSPWVWQFATFTPYRIAALGIPDSFRDDGRFFVGNGDCVYRFIPGSRERTREGETHLWLPSGLGSRTGPVTSMATIPGFASNHTLMATAGDGVYLSADEGATWQKLGAPLEGRPVVAVAPSPVFSRDGVAYALTMGGQLWMYDSGAR